MHSNSSTVYTMACINNEVWAAHTDNQFYIWDIGTRELKRSFKHTGSVITKLVRVNDYVWGASLNGKIHIWSPTVNGIPFMNLLT